MRHKTKKPFSFSARAFSFTHALRGLRIFIQSTHNAWIHLTIFVLAILLAAYFSFVPIEWIALLLSGGLVLVAEAINTGMEIHMDLTSPEFHPSARDTKDVAAAGVLLATMTAFIVGLILFVPHLLPLIDYVRLK